MNFPEICPACGLRVVEAAYRPGVCEDCFAERAFILRLPSSFSLSLKYPTEETVDHDTSDSVERYYVRGAHPDERRKSRKPKPKPRKPAA
jgi:hypothetical protein